MTCWCVCRRLNGIFHRTRCVTDRFFAPWSALLKALSLRQIRNGHHSPRIPSFLDSKVRKHLGYSEPGADIAKIGDGQDVNLFADATKPRDTPPPGLPQFDPKRAVRAFFMEALDRWSHLPPGSWESIDRDPKATTKRER